MDNKLGLLWRDNVIQLLDYERMKRTELGRLIGKSDSTMQGNFGGTKLDNLPQNKTIKAIERAFGFSSGALSKPDFNPAFVEHQTPSEAAREGQAEPMAMLSIPVSPDKLERIMRILNE